MKMTLNKRKCQIGTLLTKSCMFCTLPRQEVETGVAEEEEEAAGAVVVVVVVVVVEVEGAGVAEKMAGVAEMMEEEEVGEDMEVAAEVVLEVTEEVHYRRTSLGSLQQVEKILLQSKLSPLLQACK